MTDSTELDDDRLGGCLGKGYFSTGASLLSEE